MLSDEQMDREIREHVEKHPVILPEDYQTMVQNQIKKCCEGEMSMSQNKQRKKKMIELGEAFIAFPGGTGTLEEITEVMSKVSLKHLEAPCILYNLNGYYDHLKALLALMIEQGLSSEERQEGIFFAENLEEIRQILSGK